jgi:hypothetical protein
MSPQRPSGSPADLGLTHEGSRLVTLTMGINLYSGTSFYDCPAAVLGAWALFQKFCPPEQLKFYATETMTAHKPITKRVLNMPDTWLKPGAPRKAYVALELKSGAAYQDAPEFKYHIWSVAASKQAKVLSLAFPADFAAERPAQMLELVQQLGESFPLVSGLAGYAFECSPYDKTRSEEYAWSASLRHPGIDIVRLPFDAKAPGTDAIKGVGWLTLVGGEMLKELGGLAGIRKKLPAEVGLSQVKHAVIVKIGAAPAMGDVNRGDILPLYRQVYALLAPRIAVAAERSMAFNLVDQFVEKTEQWYMRLGR